jgi:hypothetical protein
MSDYNNNDEVYSVRVPAGKRTYFFDVKETRGKDLYLTITESKRRGEGEGFSKHKIFLYREDFEKFEEGFVEAVDKIAELMDSGNYRDPIAERAAHVDEEGGESTNEAETSEGEVSFDDL